MRVLPRVPASPRESQARGNLGAATPRSASAIPGASRSNTASVASGVTSRAVSPVPPVDVVRSGTVTPTVNCAIGMTYLPVAEAKPGTRFTIDVRGKRAPAEVVPMPFVARKTKGR